MKKTRSTGIQRKVSEPQEHITLSMLPDFELDEEDAAKLKAWAALRAMHTGIDAERVCAMFGVTMQEITPYKQEWESLNVPKATPA